MVLSLQGIYKLDPDKSLCLLYIQFSKSNNSSDTPVTLANCVQVPSRVKDTVLVENKVQSKVKLQINLEKLLNTSCC